MKKTLVLIAALAATSVGMTASTAANLGASIDAFKARHEKILFESLPFTATGANDILEHEYKINGIEALQKRIAEATVFYEEKKTETTSARLTLEQAIATIDASIRETESNISDTKTKIV